MALCHEKTWFRTHRLGLFIHWGLYAIDGWHEQARWRQIIPGMEYERLAAEFNPKAFSPDEWIDIAEAGGMGSICFTVKHHVGFCLWDTQQTKFKVTNTPYGKDVLAMLANACRRRGMKLRLYYSVVDWHNPSYPTYGSHHELPAPESGSRPDRDAYLAYLDAQLEELCTRYGEIHGIWWDMNTMRDHDPSLIRPEINARIRRWQPQAIINDRGFDEGDFTTPERDWDKSVYEQAGFNRPVEACQSVGVQSWGWREREWYFTQRYLLDSIDRYLSKGANYLLNIGPLPDGSIPSQGASIIRGVGDWYRRVKESLEGSVPVLQMIDPNMATVTQRNNILYVHCCGNPIHDGLDLAPISKLPRSVSLLNDGRRLPASVEILPSRWEEKKHTLFLYDLPVKDFPNEPLVLRICM